MFFHSCLIGKIFLLIKVDPHAFPVENGFTVNPKVATSKVMQVEIVAVITKVSNNSDLKDKIFFGIEVFVVEISNHYLNFVQKFKNC